MIRGRRNHAKKSDFSECAHLLCGVGDDLTGLRFGEVTEHNEGSLAIRVVSKESDTTRGWV